MGGALDLHNLAAGLGPLSAMKRCASMEFGDAFQLAATLEALRGRLSEPSLRRSWTEERLLRRCAADGCDATFIKK